MNYEEIFRQRFKDLIESKSHSYRDIEDLSGISISTVSRYISGGNPPTMESLIKIATLYNVSIDWLVGLTDERNNIVKDNSKILAAYTLASDHEKEIVDLVLSDYMPK